MLVSRTIAVVIAATICGCASSSEDWTRVALSEADFDLEMLRAQNDAVIDEVMARVQELEASDPEGFRRLEREWRNQPKVSPADQIRSLAQQPLAPEERAAIEAHLVARGISLDTINFAGRLMALEDVLIEADRILDGLSRTQDKSSLLEDVVGGSFGPNDVPAWATDFVRCSNNGLPNGRVCPAGETRQYWRPNLDHATIVVVPNGAALNFLKDMFITATNELENIAGDCITSGTFGVATKSEWEAMGVGTSFVHEIFVEYGSEADACVNDPNITIRACGVLPRLSPVNVGGIIVNRMAFGPYVGVVNTQITSNTENNRGTLMHELGHTVGLAHPPNEASGGFLIKKLYVPGTSTSTTVSSIMQSFGAVGRVQHPSADDSDTFQTLFPTGSCGYVNNFSTLNAN